jgi:hypothetical protein
MNRNLIHDLPCPRYHGEAEGRAYRGSPTVMGRGSREAATPHKYARGMREPCSRSSVSPFILGPCLARCVASSTLLRSPQIRGCAVARRAPNRHPHTTNGGPRSPKRPGFRGSALR